MQNTFLIILAIFPGLLICYLIYRFDKHEKESRLPLAICFGLGILSALPALKLEEWGDSIGINEHEGFWMLMLLSFVVIALSEELVKFIVLIAYPFQKKFFNEPLDGIVYAVVIGMGFATIENIIYAGRFGTGTTIIRAFTAVPAHAVFAILMGYFTGLAKFDQKNRLRNLGLGLSTALLIHGIYDFFILQQYYEWLMLFATFTLLLSGFLSYRLIKIHQEDSPFINVVVEETNDTNISGVLEKAAITSTSKSNDDIMDAIISDLEEE
jgi:protease PrsW